MCRSLKGFCSVPTVLAAPRNRILWRNAICLLAVACVWTLAPAVAKDRGHTKGQPSQGSTAAQAEPVAIPDCLESLKLTAEQQDRIREVVREYDTKLDKVWGQFRYEYRETIRVETLLLAAIEDNLTDAQRTQLRSERRRVARQEKAMQAAGEKPNVTTAAKPASAVEEASAVVGVSLTAEEEKAAQKLQEKYLSRLRSLNRAIQGLHTRLVSLEADKLVEIEKVLSPEQLTHLREVRQNPPADSKASAIRNTSVKSE
jgi:Spy/CpxP family protein refolding chaperone